MIHSTRPTISLVDVLKMLKVVAPPTNQTVTTALACRNLRNFRPEFHCKDSRNPKMFRIIKSNAYTTFGHFFELLVS